MVVKDFKHLVAWPLGAIAIAWIVMAGATLTGASDWMHHDHLATGSLPWPLAIAIFIATWQLMIWAMMMPASLGVVLHPSVAQWRHIFIIGYSVVWTLFGLGALLGDAIIHAAAKHSLWLDLHSWVIAGGTLVLAGTYQLSDLKRRCLTAGRGAGRKGPPTTASPLAAFRRGLHYGSICLGSGWALMLVAFGLGLSRGGLEWIVLITLLMAAENTAWGVRVVNPIGYAFVAVGAAILVGPMGGLNPWALS